MNFVVGNNLFLSVRGSHFPSGFGFQPQGGMDKNVYLDDSGVWHGSYWNYLSDRPQQTLMGEGSYFRGSHEVKFGYSWRRVTVTSTSSGLSRRCWKVMSAIRSFTMTFPPGEANTFEQFMIQPGIHR